MISHVGGAWTAIASWALARAAGGTTVLRVEDIDTPRVVAGRRAASRRTSRGSASTGTRGPSPADSHAPYTQSERASIYDAKLAELAAAGLTYPCDCSRAEISRVASAPHAGEEIVYPGTCRDAPRDREMKRAPAIRLRVPDGATVAFDDLVRGRIEQHVDVSVGDFVLRRGDGVYAYQLVVAVDDAAMRISHVVRADDLLASTPRQILLMRLLGVPPDAIPSYAHVPMVVGATGDRLAKRVGSTTIRSLRERGLTAPEIVGHLAHGSAWSRASPRPLSAREVAAALQPPSSWRRAPWPLPAAWT